MRIGNTLYRFITCWVALCLSGALVVWLGGCTPDEPIEIPQEQGKDNDKDDEELPLTPPDEGLKPSDIEDYEKIYKPQEFAGMDWLSKDSQWSFTRSRQSEHFIVFWEKGFGNDPNAYSVRESMRVDIDDLLRKLESFYTVNIEELKFAEVGKNVSNLDKYKMQVYLFYQEDWMAYGAGYDDVIGAIWVNPGTCKPVGSTIAHEIGHSFQYQVYADLLATGKTPNDFSRGFRYAFGGNGGNVFWEQTAQWQSFQSYPSEIFGTHNFTVYTENCHRHVCHEWQRYASYFIHYYWTGKHGVDIISRLWREAKAPEDPVDAYMRLTGIDTEQLNAEMYEAATRFVTWDIDELRTRGVSYIGKQKCQLFPLEDGAYQVAYSHCPGTTGYNVIPLNVPEAGTMVSIAFQGLTPGYRLAPDDPGIASEEGQTVTVSTYNNSDVSRAGWRYGYVALLSDGTREYGAMNAEPAGEAKFVVPEGCDKLWFVVVGAPTSYRSHPWDEKELNDEQWPYKVTFSGTDLLGSFTIDPDAEPKDVGFEYHVTCNAANGGYELGTIDLRTNGDIRKLAQAFVMQPAVLSGNTLTIANGQTAKPAEGKIAFGLKQANGTYSFTYSANVGFYCTAEGNVGSWANNDPVWIEYDKDAFVFKYGHKPGSSVAGRKYTIKPTLVYTKNGKQYYATFTFNLQF